MNRQLILGLASLAAVSVASADALDELVPVPVRIERRSGVVERPAPEAIRLVRHSVESAPAEDDTGTAEILRAKRDIGMVLIFR